MADKRQIPLERAARMLDTDLSFLMTEIIELGIEVKRDSNTGKKYISTDGFDELKELKEIID